MILHELRLIGVALQFLTRVPVRVGFDPLWLNQSARHFPLVGALVGAVGALVLWAAGLLFPPMVAVVLSMMATVLLTGAFHEDGLADTCDALGGAVSRERALEIMKDSRIGTYGAVGLLLMLSLKAATLVALPVTWAMAALLLAHTVSRTAAVALIRWLPYAGNVSQAKAKPLAERISGAGLLMALVWSGLASAALVAWQPAWWPVVATSGLVAVVGAWACGRWFMRRLGGITGDALGATQQLIELGVLLAWVAWWPR
ncbi:adenosylcobinamide-GDP ribazoletransferase [Piscinibacter sp. HJYY11]|uniref:adenosylcobinamide-GDP ribazoletransferase n=1 Tax=Piscinibacter sp. HJYY11 TaxID=2801333 RepID=UPI00191EA915|nr:adenosylcobinamide-GDP ribazoletransferase [Piscinibacter sp. HJYY11]MBL0727004.1 adenosylcobinamide-GDP ribazoletransferase [Piscinibacter sp. HJYY11]